MNRVLKYSAVLIAIYLGVAHATGGGRLLASGSSAGVDIIEAFQGRS